MNRGDKCDMRQQVEIWDLKIIITEIVKTIYFFQHAQSDTAIWLLSQFLPRWFIY